ncbi:DUF2884 family protein [Calditrichota bacterium LG25]
MRIKYFHSGLLFVSIFLPLILWAQNMGLDDFNIELDEKNILIKLDSAPWTEIKITENSDLLINGERIDLDRREQKLVAEYYDQTMALIQNAKKLGFESVKLALEAIAKTSLYGISALVGEVFGDYDAEEELEKVTEEMDKKARSLELRGKKLEKMGDQLQKLHAELFWNVKPLRQLLEDD